jgi:hypothetical protein
MRSEFALVMFARKVNCWVLQYGLQRICISAKVYKSGYSDD